jgi:thioredoxin:protein disulfide reductase
MSTRAASNPNFPAFRAAPARSGAVLGVVLGLGLVCLLAGRPEAWGADNAGSAGNANSAALNALLDQAQKQAQSSSTGDDFLPPDKAFHFTARADGAQRVQLSWAIAPGYYLYRDRIHVASAAATVEIGATQFPPGQVKQDDYFGKQVVYHSALVATVPVTHAPADAHAVPLRVTYQGCAEAGLCYPPIVRTISIELPAAAAGTGAGGTGTAAGTGAAGGQGAAGSAGGATAHVASAAGAAAVGSGYVSEQDRLATLISSGNMLGVLGTFFGLGLLLAFTPCCLPMVPILSGLIVGSGRQLSTARAFSLSLTYVLGMALTYTVLGAGFAAAGKQVQAAFEQPWIVALFAALFVAMALSMFGLYTVQMPSVLQTRLTVVSNRQQGGHFGGVAVMGALSALIVTTCVAPPLVATLAVIGQSGAIARGAAALFVMALGMGAPLLVVGSSAGRWLPKAGAWMDTVKQVFGVLMLALAAWVLTRIVPARFNLVLFAVPVFAAAVVLGARARGATARGGGYRLGHSLAVIAAVLVGLYGAALLIGATRGDTDPLRPLSRTVAAQEPTFYSISSLAQLNSEVQAAAAHGQPVMLDFYADWCTSCLEMQHFTFNNPEVQAALHGARLLRADVTANNADDQALLRQFQIYGPPTIAFYDDRGREQRRYRVVGFMSAHQFAALVRQAFASS